MYQRKNSNILPHRAFVRRVLTYSGVAFSLILVSVGIGILGYHFIGGLDWIDSMYNASMILTGMGPVDQMTTESAKIFASLYALFSGIVFLSTVAVFFAPFAHRLMHILHVETDENKTA